MNSVKELKVALVGLVMVVLSLLIAISGEMDARVEAEARVIEAQIRADSIARHLEYCQKILLEINYFEF